MPGLRVLAGTSLDALVPITEFVNTNKSFKLPTSDLFEGEVVCNIKDFPDENGGEKDSEYFEREDRKGITWSIQVQGRFLKPYTADDVLFGNTFDRPLHLPWGSGAALKFMNYIDPTLTHDLTSPTKPWALSPLISTMPHFTHTRLSSPGDDYDSPIQSPIDDIPEFPPQESLTDDTSQLHLAMVSRNSSSSGSGSASSSNSSSNSSASSSSSSLLSSLSSSSGSHTTHNQKGSSSENTTILNLEKGKSHKSALSKLKLKTHKNKRDGVPGSHLKNQPLNLPTASQRRSYFSSAENRKKVVLGPEDIITTDFCYGFLQFSPSLSLRIPGGLSFDLMKYWDGQPVRFVCCERKKGKGKHRKQKPQTRSGDDGDLRFNEHGYVDLDRDLDLDIDGNNRSREGEEDADEDSDEVPWGKVFWCVAIEPA